MLPKMAGAPVDVMEEDAADLQFPKGTVIPNFLENLITS